MTTQELARLIVETTSGDIPAAAIDAAKSSLLNWLGVTVGASRHPLIDKLVDLAQVIGGNAQATVLGRGNRTDVLTAAMINGTSSHIFDYDDTFLDTILHPSAPVAPAALALAELLGSSGRSVIEAFIVGVEAEQRVAQVVYPSHYDRGWHITGSVGGFGAAAAAARLLNLDAEQTTMALGIAATQPVGLREMFGTHTKPLHPGRAAANGLAAAMMAQRGVTSSVRAIEAPRGFAHVTSEQPKLARLTDGWGQSWQITSNSYKPFPCGVVIHPIIDGVVRLGRQCKIAAADVSELQLRVHPLVLELTGKTAPRDGLEAKFSVYHCAAAALLDGWVGLAQFADQRVTAPDVIDLRGRVTAVADPSIGEDQAYITARLAGGGMAEVWVEHCLGSKDNPMTDELLERKLMDVTQGVIPPQQAQALIKAVRALDAAPDLRAVVELAQ